MIETIQQLEDRFEALQNEIKRLKAASASASAELQHVECSITTLQGQCMELEKENQVLRDRKPQITYVRVS